MRPIYKSLALAAMTLQVSLALNAQTRDDESASTMALPADLLDSLRVELVALNVSGARDLIASGECVIDGSDLAITLNAANWIKGATYRVQVLATFGTQTQVIYALNVTVPYYAALSDIPQEFEDDVTIVSTITDVTEADLDGLALEATSQEIKSAITPISLAAESYNVGKPQLAAAITSKGVETSPTETYPEMAEKVNAISQETYEINGGEMYAKQLFGVANNNIVPGYWNLYEIMAQLLSDGRLVNYGGILLAEYYKGYDSLALSGAGAGGAYVVSDLDENGQFKMYTEDTTHTWATEFDGKGNRWVAYCFADEYHDFQITDTNTSPRSIFIGRKVGTITSLVAGRVSQIVVPDGNELKNISGTYTQQWDKKVVIRNLGDFNGVAMYRAIGIESAYIHAKKMSGGVLLDDAEGGAPQWNLSSLILEIEEATNGAIFGSGNNQPCFNGLKYLNIKADGALYINKTYNSSLPFNGLKELVITAEQLTLRSQSNGVFPISAITRVRYTTNDKTKSIVFSENNISSFNRWRDIQLLELQDGWCKPINCRLFTSLTEQNIYTYILQRLKQDEPDCGDGVTITLGSTNLAKLTSAESVQLLDDLTNIYGYTFA